MGQRSLRAEETAVRYVIRIQGHLPPHRLRHFATLTVRHEAAGSTLIAGRFRDQAALYGLLHWLQSLGVTLLLVKREDS